MKEKIGKKGTMKRLYSFVLALAMVVALMPMNVITVYAAKQTITFDFNGGVDEEGNESKTFTTNHQGLLSNDDLETIFYLNISKDGYKHDGWLDRYDNPIELKDNNFYNDDTLYANWVEASSYSVDDIINAMEGNECIWLDDDKCNILEIGTTAVTAFLNENKSNIESIVLDDGYFGFWIGDSEYFANIYEEHTISDGLCSRCGYSEDSSSVTIETKTSGTLSYTNGPVTITGVKVDSDGLYLNNNNVGATRTITISLSAAEGTVIQKIEATVGYGKESYASEYVLVADYGSVPSTYSKTKGSVITISNINQTSVTLSNSVAVGRPWIFSSFKVYYGAPVTHEHSFSTDWSFDETNHWHACTGTGATADCLNEAGAAKAAHSGGTATCTTQAVCETCGASYGEFAAHNYGYSATDNVLTATCQASGCTKSVSLTLSASSANYSGIEGLTAFNEATGKTIAESNVEIYKVDAADTTTGGEKVTGTPSADGYYYAKLTVETATAVKAFTIGTPGGSGSGSASWIEVNKGGKHFLYDSAHIRIDNVTMETYICDTHSIRAVFNAGSWMVYNPCSHLTHDPTWPTAIHSGCSNSGAGHIWLTGNTYTLTGGSTAYVEGKKFNSNGTTVELYDGVSVGAVAADEFGLGPNGWYYNDGINWNQCPSHTHVFAYNASGSTLTATCSAANCSISGDTKSVSLTLTASSANYSGIENLEAFNTATGKTISTNNVKFYQVETADTTEGGTAVEGTPSADGYYYAVLEITGITPVAKKAFTIGHPSWPTAVHTEECGKPTATYHFYFTGNTFINGGVTYVEGRLFFNNSGDWSSYDYYEARTDEQMPLDNFPSGATAGWYYEERELFKVCTPPHTWAYTVDGTTLTATCDQACGEAEAHEVTLTLTASDANYSGNPVSLTVENFAWSTTDASLATPVIGDWYVDATTKTTTANSGATSDGGAPKYVGNYLVEVTVGSEGNTATAKYPFEITPAKLGETNTFWNIKNGVLTISGTGAMPDYGISTTPWYSSINDITSVVIEDNVTSIGNYAFYYCGQLKSVTIPSGITSIGIYAFQGCKELAGVTIPDTVTSIGNNAFYNCKKVTTVTIPSSVTTIGDSAFNNSGLTNVTIPSSVTSIGASAFRFCQSLASVTMKATNPPALGASAFGSCPSDLKIYVPSAAVATYKAATNWSSYESKIVPDHVHTWNYSVSGATLTATCNASGCTDPVATATLTLTASDTNYSGSAVTADFENASKTAWTAAELALPTITYEAKEGSELTDSNAVKVGSYTAKASITVKVSEVDTTYTATKDFEITKATPHIATKPTASELTYGDTLSASTFTGGAAQNSSTNTTAVTGTFAWTTDTTVPTVGNTGYEVTFTPTDTNNYNTTTCTVIPTVTAKALTADDITVTAPSSNGSTLNDSITVKFGNTTLVEGTDYDVTYAPETVKDAGEYKATLTFKGNYSGTSVEKTFTVSKPSSGGSSSNTITAPASVENGKVSVDKTKASSGETVTITVTPDKGYTLDTLTVKDANGKAVELTKVNDTTYTFKMPSGKVTVDATFKKADMKFVDVAGGTYYCDAVQWAIENGITDGTDDTHFSPNAITTRAQVVTFLWRAAGCPEPKSMTSFGDVSANSYYEKAVAWAVENGITDGVGDGKFAPDQVCTRAQIVTFLYRYNAKDTMNIKVNPFTDIAEGAYFYDAVLWASETGVTDGTSDITFSPANNCTRGQTVTFLYRLLNK